MTTGATVLEAIRSAGMDTELETARSEGQRDPYVEISQDYSGRFVVRHFTYSRSLDCHYARRASNVGSFGLALEEAGRWAP